MMSEFEFERQGYVAGLLPPERARSSLRFHSSKVEGSSPLKYLCVTRGARTRSPEVTWRRILGREEYEVSVAKLPGMVYAHRCSL